MGTVRTCLVLLCLALTACPAKRATKGKEGLDPGDQPATTSKPPPEPKHQCTGARQCVLSGKGCCAPCWADDLSSMDAHSTRERPPSEKRCRGQKVDCAQCRMAQGVNPALTGLCKAYKCVGLDIRKSPYSACKEDKDCFLVSAACCGCSAYPTAFSRQGREAYRKRKCLDIACAACARPAYTGMSTACVDGHCVARGVWDCKGGRCPVQRPQGGKAKKK